MLLVLGMLAVLATQPAAAERSPYLDAVRRYGAGTEGEAMAALYTLRLTRADKVFEELDTRVCNSAGARSCLPARLAAEPGDVRERVHAAWRRLYPRALAVHIEALANADPVGDPGSVTLHREIVRRLIARLEVIGREPSAPAPFATVAATGRRLLLWALQFLGDEVGLADTVDAFEAEGVRDLEQRLARADLEELRAMPHTVAATVRRRSLMTSTPSEGILAQEQARQLGRAVRAYDAILADQPACAEARVRLARVLLRLGRLADAETQLQAVARLERDARQTYFAAIFLADVRERQGRRADAIAAYDAARLAWPGAQTPVVALARLRALEGAHAEARAALATLALGARDAGDGSDPWHGYDGGQGWRLPAAIAALQATFEPW